MLGIIGAMQIEIENIVNLMDHVDCEVFSHIKFFSGKINNTDCVVALCGPGKVNAAICTQILISKFCPDFVINIGVAGALEKNIKIGDIVLADAVVQHDMDTSAVGDAKGFISGINLIQIPCSTIINEKIKAATASLNENIHIGTVATGDQFISNREKLFDIKNRFNAVACDMEAGSVGHVCFVNNVNLTAVKVVSDNANEQSHIDYENFKIIVSQKLTQLIAKIISNF